MDEVEQLILQQLRAAHAAALACYEAEKAAPVGSRIRDVEGRRGGMHSRNTISLTESLRLYRSGGATTMIVEYRFDSAPMPDAALSVQLIGQW